MLKHVFYLVFCALTHTHPVLISGSLSSFIFALRWRLVAVFAWSGFAIWSFVFISLDTAPPPTPLFDFWGLEQEKAESSTEQIQFDSRCDHVPYNKTRFGWVKTDRSSSQDGKLKWSICGFNCGIRSISPCHRRPNRSVESCERKKIVKYKYKYFPFKPYLEPWSRTKCA